MNGMTRGVQKNWVEWELPGVQQFSYDSKSGGTGIVQIGSDSITLRNRNQPENQIQNQRQQTWSNNIFLNL